MAKHEFGIMEIPPNPFARYDEYEPEKYGCISIDDDYIEILMPLFGNIPCYWHTLQRPETNLAYCGVTLIPPASLKLFLSVFREQNSPAYDEISSLFCRAEKEHKYVIHFGL